MKREKLPYIVPECYVDTNLIEYLLSAAVNHQHSCSKVVEVLKTNYYDKFAVGIIDDDKHRLGYIDECSNIARTNHLLLLKHKESSHYLIMVTPAIDKFILDCAKEQKVKPEDYNLPSELKEFTKVSKSVSSNKDPKFKSLFAAVKGNSEIQSLKRTLKYLCEKQHQADIDSLRGIFSLPCKEREMYDGVDKNNITRI